MRFTSKLQPIIRAKETARMIIALRSIRKNLALNALFRLGGHERKSRDVHDRLSGHEHNYDDVRGEGFFGQARRERRAYPSGVCEERATKFGRKRTAARRVAPNLACGGVARRSQIHFGICSLLAPCHRPNSAQRTSS